MIKNKNKLILVLSILLCTFINIHCVEAAFQARYYNKSTSTGITRWNGTNYTTYEYEMKDPNGVSYRAYCMDPGKSLPDGWNDYQCETLNGDNPHSGRFMWILDHLTDNNTINVLAVRMLAVATGTNNFANNNYTAASIVNYWWGRQCAEGGHAGNTNCSSYDKNYKQYLYGKNDTAESIINSAYQLATQAYDNAGYKGNMSDGGYIKFEKDNGKSSENHIFLKISSDKTIDKNNLKFTCKECEKIEWTWNGTSGEIELVVAQPNCSYTINSYYGASGYYMCSSTKGGSFQKLLTVIHNETNSFEANAIETSTVSQPPFVGKIEAGEGGEYYKNYCDDDKVCTEKTKIEIPSYCDDASGKQITITSPKNVVQCILFNSDETDPTPNHSQQNYRMDDTQIKSDNPYCTVWCKEDYNMELPGAKYGDSGRYFSLEDTKVHAKRTCYATGADKNTKNIDIDKFIKNAIDLQKKIVENYNKYVIDKAKDELISGASYTSNGSVCSPDSVPNDWRDVNDAGKNVIVYDIKCDNETAVCELTPKTKNVTTSDYGNKHSTYNTTETNADGTVSTKCNNSTDSVDHEKTNTQSYLNAMDAAATELKNKIGHFEDCYNWKNNLCFNPEVLFRYKELYGVDFGEKSLGTSVDVNVGYKTDKTIDNQYESLISGNPSLGTYNYATCTSSGCNNSETATSISTLKEKIYYLRKESTGDATYNNRKEFSTNYPHGTIEEVPSGATGPYEDYYYLGAVFPIMFKTPTGVYNWSIKFQGIGQYNNRTTEGAPRCSTNALGRLNQVAQSIGKASLGTDLEYVCVYVVDCPECEYECICGDNPDCVEKYENGEKFCIINHPEPECPDCEIYCNHCLFDGDGATYDYRQISLDVVNPNNRNMGSNWNNEKGEATIKAIENANESIYKNSEYSYVITPTQMKNIRDYNKNIGTYINEDLNFHTSGNNVYGISEFLDKGQSLGYFKELKRNSDWSSKVWTNIGDHQGPSWK